MKKGLHPKLYTVEVVCSTCKTKFNIVSSREHIKADACSHCHPFYTGDQKIVDTANKVKDYERRKDAAIKMKPAIQAKARKQEKVREIRADRALTLKDMLKSIQ